MPSEWITHVKKVAKQKNISYKEAMSVAKSSYKGGKDKKVPAVKATGSRKPMKKGNVKESTDSK